MASMSQRVVVLSYYAVLLVTFAFIAWLMARSPLPSPSLEAGPTQTVSTHQCLRWVEDGFFLPCKHVEPRLYLHEWLASRISI